MAFLSQDPSMTPDIFKDFETLSSQMLLMTIELLSFQTYIVGQSIQLERRKVEWITSVLESEDVEEQAVYNENGAAPGKDRNLLGA
jgi:hypothetical protein